MRLTGSRRHVIVDGRVDGEIRVHDGDRRLDVPSEGGRFGRGDERAGGGDHAARVFRQRRRRAAGGGGAFRIDLRRVGRRLHRVADGDGRRARVDDVGLRVDVRRLRGVGRRGRDGGRVAE